MKIRAEQLGRLADDLLKSLRSKELIFLKAKEDEIRARITAIVARNFEEEAAIEEEARKMLASQTGKMKEVDRHKMFLLIKQKLAQKRGFVL